ncbi:hypothetical protein ACTFIU_007534 [Dictyostelium citrinum]
MTKKYQKENLFTLDVLIRSSLSNDLINGESSIVSEEGLFKDGNTTKNFLFYGGFITSCLTGQTEGFENCDIDVIMLKDKNGNFSTSQYIEKVKNIFGEDYQDKIYPINAMGGLVVFSLQYPNRPIQFNLHEYSNIEELFLLGVDIDCCCLAFGGNHVWTLERASQFSHKVRGEDYQRHLLKYLSGGKDIHYHNTPGIQEIIDSFDMTDQSKMNKSLPYGPQWEKDNFDHYMNQGFKLIFHGYSYPGFIIQSNQLIIHSNIWIPSLMLYNLKLQHLHKNYQF